MSPFKECSTDRANLRRLMRALRKKGAFARMGLMYHQSNANFEARWRTKPGTALVYCTKQEIERVFHPDDGMCWNTLYLNFDIHMPDGMKQLSAEYDQAVRGVAHLILTTAEELGIPNIEWDGEIGECVSMTPRPERLK